jgi:outer membrane protein
VTLRKSLSNAAFGSLLLFALAPSASAETITQALASAYSSNPEINSARAETRANDENVPLARSGYLPIVSLFNTTTHTRSSTALNALGDQSTLSNAVGVTISQSVFTGFRVRNALREAESGVLASRELLNNTVQNVLFDAAQAYMDVLRDIQILDIRRSNVLFLEEQVRAANERFNVGENTRTDVAQARARLANARAAVSLAEANLATSRATYRQIIGHDPNGLSESFAVKQIEGELLPSVSVEGTLQHSNDFNTDAAPNTATIVGRVSIPIYQGGAVSSRVRQAKEIYGQRKIEIDVARDQVRAAVVSAWAQAAASEEAIVAAGEGVSAAEIALSGVQEEQRVGQRTTLDVLDAQQELLSSRETLIVARRDRVVAYFAVLSAMGRLTGEALSLPAPLYDPSEHYRAVHNKLGGTRTPDGR